eukprot:1829246-Lingulodinium_polyedra.AAC.1
MSAAGSAFRLGQSLGRRRRALLDGPVCDELLALAFLWPLLEGDLTAPALTAPSGAPLVFATDAEGSGGLGACLAEVTTAHWDRLYVLTEEKG